MGRLRPRYLTRNVFAHPFSVESPTFAMIRPGRASSYGQDTATSFGSSEVGVVRPSHVSTHGTVRKDPEIAKSLRNAA